MMRWTTSLIALASVASMLACSSEDDSNGANDAQPVDIVVDTFNIAMAGSFVPNAEERRQPLLDSIAASQADVLCLQEVWQQADKDAVVAAAQERYPHAVWFAHDLDTAIDDPTDQDGEVPAPFTTPPCGDPDLQTKLDVAMECLRDKCSTIPGSEEGKATSTACAEAECVAEAAALLLGDAAHKRCYACVAVNLTTETFAKIRNDCTTEVNAGLAYDGQSSVMILSKYPMTGARDYVLPGTYNRRVIATATTVLPNGAELDIHCNHLTPIFDGLTRPYTGAYGGGETDAAGWAAEQLLQADKLLSYVKEHSAGHPSLVLGDLNAGRAYPDDENPVIFAESAATLDLLETAFLPAVTPDYQPLCTYCDTNGNTDTEHPAWIDHIYTYNFEASAVIASERVYDQDVVPVQDGSGGTTLVPLSDHYGMRGVLRVPAP